MKKQQHQEHVPVPQVPGLVPEQLVPREMKSGEEAAQHSDRSLKQVNVLKTDKVGKSGILGGSSFILGCCVVGL